MLDLVRGLDVAQTDFVIDRNDPRGARPLDPRMRRVALFCADAHGIYSSRNIERTLLEDMALRVITGNVQPDHDSIARFGRKPSRAFEALCVQGLPVGARDGLCRVGHMSIDGTKTSANARQEESTTSEPACARAARRRQGAPALALAGLRL